MFVIHKPWVVAKYSSRSPLSLVCCLRAYSPVTPSRLLPLQWSHSVATLCMYDDFRLCVCSYVCYVRTWVCGRVIRMCGVGSVGVCG